MRDARENQISPISRDQEMTQTPRWRRIGEQAGELECLLHILEATYGQTDCRVGGGERRDYVSLTGGRERGRGEAP